jgi:HEAT repeat protein
MPEVLRSPGIPLPTFRQVLLLLCAGTACWLIGDAIRDSRQASDRTSGFETRRDIVNQLVDEGLASIPQLTDMLSNSDPNVRRDALIVCERLGRQASDLLPSVRERLADRDPEIRSYAQIAFMRISPDRADILRITADQLSDPEKELRDSGAAFLKKIGVPSIPILIETTRATSPAARQAVAQLLRDIDRNERSPTQVNEALRGMLPDRDDRVRLEAISAIVARGDAEVEETRDWLGDNNSQVVSQGLIAVRTLDSAADLLLPELRRLIDGSGALSLDLVLALCHLRERGRPAVPGIVARISSLPLADRVQALRYLAGVGGNSAEVAARLTELFASDDQYLAFQAGWTLARFSPEVARRLALEAVERLEATEDQSINAIQVAQLAGLAGQAPEAVPLLVRLVDHRDRQVQALALEGLAGIGPPAESAVPALIALLDPRSPETLRMHGALDALAAIGSPAHHAVPRLIELLEQSEPAMSNVRMSGRASIYLPSREARALGRIGAASEAGVALLRRHLRLGTEASYLLCVVQALFLTGQNDQSVVKDLQPLLDHRDRKIRVQLALAIGHLRCGGSRSVERLIFRLNDPDASVRIAAALALEQFGGQALPAAPRLREMISDTRNRVRFAEWPTADFVFVPDDCRIEECSVSASARRALAAIDGAVPGLPDGDPGADSAPVGPRSP